MLLGVLGFIVLVGAAIYLPPVQKFAIGKAAEMVAQKTGMQLTVNEFRIRFPMGVTVSGATLITAEGDTLARAGTVRARAALLPLLVGRVTMRGILVEDAASTYRDTVSGMLLRARLADFEAGSASFGLKTNSVRLARASLSGADVVLVPGDGQNAPKKESTTVASWKFDIGRLDLADVGFAMDVPSSGARLDTRLGSGTIRNVAISTGASADSLELGAGRVEVSSGSIVYVSPLPKLSPEPSPIAFDPANIRADEVELNIRDFLYRAGEISAALSGLGLVERSGIRVTDGSGDFSMTGAGFALSNFKLETSDSQITADAEVGNGIIRIEPQTPVSLNLSARIGSRDLSLFVPSTSAVRRALGSDDLTLNAVAGGTLGDISVTEFTASMPGRMDFKAQGRVHSVTKPAEISGNAAFEGEFRELAFVKDFIVDTTLRKRIGFPRLVTLRGEGTFSPESYDLSSLTVNADGGSLDASGQFAPQTKTYNADVRLTEFPLGEFLPRDSLGAATLSLEARGRGLDPFGGMNLEADAKIDSLQFHGFGYHDMAITASLEDGRVAGHISSSNEALSLDLALGGTIERGRYAVTAAGRVWRADIHAMGFADDVLAVESRLDVSVGAVRDTLPGVPMSYSLSAQIDSTIVRHGEHATRVANSTIEATAAANGSSATVRSGDLSVDLVSRLPLDSLIRSAGHINVEVRRQIAARNFSADSLQHTIPDMTLTAQAGRRNFLRDWAVTSGVDFRGFTANVSTAAGQPFGIDALVAGLSTGRLVVDTIGLKAARNGSNLDYALRMANRPENIDNFALLRLGGSVGGNAASVNVYETGRNDSIGFRFGVNATLMDNTLKATITPVGLTLGYEQWTVNGDNSIEYDTDGKFRANLHLRSSSPGEYVNLTSASLPDIPDGALRLEMAGLDIAPILDLLPTAPPLGGTVSSDLTFGLRDGGANGGKIIAATGDLGVGNFTYNENRVADIAASVDFQSDITGRMALSASVDLDGNAALSAKGTYSAQAMDFTVAFPRVPLSMVEAFLPDGTARLSGEMDGNIHVTGTATSPSVTGDAGFTRGRVAVGITGTSFGISPDRITVAGSTLTFNDFGLVAPNNSKLAVNGTMNLSDITNPYADLRVSTRNFRVVDSDHIGGSQVYGNAAFDADITARGALSSMKIQGNASLAETTDIVYILRNQSKIKDEKQHIVQFMVFADSLYTDGMETARARRRRTGLDMRVGVTIPEGVKATLSLDEQNENRVELVGEGNLAFSMNTQGDTRLSGRYTLSGGTVYYRPPVISQKVFDVTDGSYVEWTGQAVAPEFHVTATQAMTADLTYDDGVSEQVEFDITIDISGSLAAMDMRFDLAAPGNLLIQDQLLSMSDEGRMQQALTLLVYGQYTGPGVSSQRRSGMDTARSSLNNFISKELNQWARNNLSGVDLSMGIDSRNDALGEAHTNYSYSVSKSMFSDRVKVSVGGSVADNASSQNFAGSLLEDITLEYRLTKRDNMFLKLYRYNTRESILEGEVTETGGGFMMRKKMNRVGDLFRRTRPKKERRGDNEK